MIPDDPGKKLRKKTVQINTKHFCTSHIRLLFLLSNCVQNILRTRFHIHALFIHLDTLPVSIAFPVDSVFGDGCSDESRNDH